MRTGMILFSIGVFLGMILSGVAIWGDLEATLFDRNLSHLRDASKALRCPVFMTAKETGTVSAAFTNPLERPGEFLIRAHVSQFLTLMREDTTRLLLEPGETKHLEWTVTADDVVYGHLILVKVLQHRKYPVPARLGSCGIVVVDLPHLTGNQILAFALVASLLGMAAGGGLCVVATKPLSGSGLDAVRAMGTLGGSVAAGIIVSLLGWWVVGVLALVAELLLIGAILGHFAQN